MSLGDKLDKLEVESREWSAYQGYLNLRPNESLALSIGREKKMAKG